MESSVRWDRARRVPVALLVIQFGVCVGCWTLVVLGLEGRIGRSGFVSSMVTGAVLALITWTLAKLGWPPDATGQERPSQSLDA
jgi:heme A synthase